jgi:hypothetical protein
VSPVRQDNLDLRGAAGDMTVGDEVTVRRDEKTRARAVGPRSPPTAPAPDSDMCNRRRDPRDGGHHRGRVRIVERGIWERRTGSVKGRFGRGVRGVVERHAREHGACGIDFKQSPAHDRAMGLPDRRNIGARAKVALLMRGYLL